MFSVGGNHPPCPFPSLSYHVNNKPLVQSILVYAVRWNSVQESAAARRDLLDSWRQVTEVLLLAAPAEHLPPVSKQQILLQLLQTLLNKVSEIFSIF